ncbi:hypothetical protein ACIRRA_23050 [Nocardia sp. NPDC101769]|uniref:hypothetical protein n=1 Tax=Nocardia sp. NPDC101769 TaxID=3364333 RepID=UPI0038238CEF
MTAFLTTTRKAAFAMAAIAAAFFVVLAGAGTANASGVNAEIKFAPGTDHGTVDGYINRGYTDTWMLDASAGQQMSTEIISHYTSASGTAIYTLTAPDGQQMVTSATGSELWLPATGTYRLTITSPEHDASYTMNIKID